jgi:MFS family permease
MDLKRFGWRPILAIATFAMLIQQAFSYTCQLVMPILADRIAEDFGISRGWLGLYLFIQNMVAILAAMGCGGIILRYGPLRVSQFVLLQMALGIFLISTGYIWLFVASAVLLGMSAVSTPASSQILARVCPPRLAPLIFSVKQTGVPVGSLIGGLLIPLLLGTVFYSATLGTTVRLGTYGAAFVTAVIVVGVAVLLQPFRDYFDADRKPNTKLSLGDLRQTMRMVVDNPPVRDIAFAAFAFGGLQSLFAGFFILYLIDGLNYSEAQAGSVYAIASFSAIFARIAWGIGGGIVSARLILGMIGLTGGLSALWLTQLSTTWTLFEITVLAVLYNMTAISWHGILLAEIARLAPKEQVGAVTGGVLSFTSVAMMIYPAIYGFLLATTGSYRIGFALGAIPAFMAFLIFMRPPVTVAWRHAVSELLSKFARWRTLAVGALVIGLGIGIGLATY